MIYVPSAFEKTLISIQPMQDFDEHCVICSLEDADYLCLYASDGTFPTTRHQSHETFDAAYKAAYALCPNNVWYNGAEVLCKILDVEGLFAELCTFYSDKEGADWLRETLRLVEHKK